MMMIKHNDDNVRINYNDGYDDVCGDSNGNEK